MYKDILIVFLAVMLIVIGYKSCQNESLLREQSIDILDYKSNNQIISKTIDDKNREITEVKSLVIQQSEIISKHLKEIQKLKSLDAKIVFETKTLYDSIKITMTDTLIINSLDTISARKVNYKDKWLLINGFTYNDTLFFDSLIVDNKYSIEIGDVRNGLFKKKKVAYIVNENPYSKTTMAQSFIIKDDKKWYQKKGVQMLGLGLGVFFIASKR